MSNLPVPAGLTVHDAVTYAGYRNADDFYDDIGSLRIGQHWFNSLAPSDQEVLRGTLADPFYSDAWNFVLNALRVLLESEPVTG